MTAFSAIVIQEVVMSIGLHLSGADIQSTLLVAGGLAVISCEVAARLLGRNDDGPGGTAPAVVA